MRKLVVVTLAALFMVGTTVAYAHSGGTNSEGCHKNHKTGGYHCH